MHSSIRRPQATLESRLETMQQRWHLQSGMHARGTWWWRKHAAPSVTAYMHPSPALLLVAITVVSNSDESETTPLPLLISAYSPPPEPPNKQAHTRPGGAVPSNCDTHGTHTQCASCAPRPHAQLNLTFETTKQQAHLSAKVQGTCVVGGDGAYCSSNTSTVQGGSTLPAMLLATVMVVSNIDELKTTPLPLLI
jgi:hypothetical protein